MDIFRLLMREYCNTIIMKAIRMFAAVAMLCAVAMLFCFSIIEHRKNTQWQQFMDTVRIDCQYAPTNVTTPDGEVIILHYVIP